jgi:predicted outer membrane repeat protein
MRANAVIFLAFLMMPGTAMAGGTVKACVSDVQQNAGLNLKDAIAGGGTVYFDCGGSAEIRITQTHHLTQSVEIDGGGRITLVADPGIGMFTAAVSAELVVLRNLVLRGASSVSFGGVFSGQASALKLFNVTAESVGQSPGPVFGFVGGFIIRANRIDAEDCRFRDNAGAVLLAPTLVVKRSEFRGNAGQPFMPDFVDDGGEASIEDSTFSGNGVSVWRGSIQIRKSGFFSNGRGSPAYGGALTLRGTATIEKTEFLNNRAPNGAAVWFSSGDLTLRRATFEGNIATGVGGALGVSNAEVPTRVSIRYSHFRQNQAASGGAIAFQRVPASERALRGYAMNFANNSANENGGAINAPSGAIECRACKWSITRLVAAAEQFTAEAISI